MYVCGSDLHSGHMNRTKHRIVKKKRKIHFIKHLPDKGEWQGLNIVYHAPFNFSNALVYEEEVSITSPSPQNNSQAELIRSFTRLYLAPGKNISINTDIVEAFRF